MERKFDYGITQQKPRTKRVLFFVEMFIENSIWIFEIGFETEHIQKRYLKPIDKSHGGIDLSTTFWFE